MSKILYNQTKRSEIMPNLSNRLTLLREK
ncbi:transcriptional regulator, partial [Listeria monocytogenes]|nr:transcriptional regulator [Listeria monocytogenes]